MLKRFIGLSLLAAAPTVAQIATPDRPVTDPRALVSPSDPQARPVPIEDAVFSRGVLDFTWSPDGKGLYLSTNLTGRYNIWRTDGNGGWPVQLTQSDDRQRDLSVSPDGRTLYYIQDQGGNEHYDVYAVPTAGGAPQNLTDTPDFDEGGLVISPDGRSGALTVARNDDGLFNLAVMNLGDRKVRTLTHETDPVWYWEAKAWVDEGHALIANHANIAGDSEVWKVDVATGKATKLLGKAGESYAATGITSDGRFVALTTNHGTPQSHAAILDSTTGTIRNLRPTPWEQSSGAISPDDRWMIAMTNEDGRQTVKLVDMATLAERPLPMPVGINNPQAAQPFTRDGRTLMVLHSGADSPSEIYSVDLATGKAEPITHLALASLSPEHLPKSQIVTYRSFDGTVISAVVTMPFNLRRDGSNPAILYPHGGPADQSLDRFDRTATALASRGYIVVQSNYRGSTGYGPAFRDANYKDLGNGDVKDVIAARQFLIDSGYVDPKRMGIYSGSYGGFLTLMAISRYPTAFTAAASLYGIVDWKTLFKVSNPVVKAYFEKLIGGSPEDNPKIYEAVSPLNFITAAKAPLLILQGESDTRVPASQTRQLVNTMKAAGQTVDAIYYPEEGHGFSKRENQIDSLRRIVEWFDKNLKGAK